jgi:transposase
MQYITGLDRTQAVLFAQSLDEIIDANNEVRIIDLFIESIDITQFSFHIKLSSKGRPPDHPKDLLKLYVYGYLNSIRSSRRLEKQCKRNVEVMWLLHKEVPDHNTISNFRRDNEKAIRKVFCHTISIAKQFDLIGGKLIAGDSTKLRAQNSKKNNFNEAQITQHLEYIERKLDEYNQALEVADGENKKITEQEIEKQNQKKKQIQSTQCAFK